MRARNKRQRRTIWLAAGRRLHKERSGTHVLLGRGGPIQLNETAASILALCDGRRSAEEIIARVLLASEDPLSEDIAQFLETAARRGWIVQR